MIGSVLCGGGQSSGINNDSGVLFSRRSPPAGTSGQARNSNSPRDIDCAISATCSIELQSKVLSVTTGVSLTQLPADLDSYIHFKIAEVIITLFPVIGRGKVLRFLN